MQAYAQSCTSMQEQPDLRVFSSRGAWVLEAMKLTMRDWVKNSKREMGRDVRGEKA